jgi:molybdopterin-biosynthesis enzyme MoeA-like protein
MLVKTQHALQPAQTPAHSVVIEDRMGNPIFVAIEVDEAIVYSTPGEPDFHSLLRACGVTKTVTVTNFKPKPIENVVWTP